MPVSVHDFGAVRHGLWVLAAGMLAACAAAPPVPKSGEDRVVEQRVRAPSEGSETELQVFRVRNPAVEALGREALTAEHAGDLARSEMLLERALRIDGRDPFILQQMAELQLTQGRLQSARAFAQQAWELGPQVGEICQRTLRTLVVIAEREQRWDDAYQLGSRIGECRVAPPARF